ncbi:MAG: OmpA family protein [Planctomyces sp.]|nr:OmpA family protein [Planctomyces sp.]
MAKGKETGKGLVTVDDDSQSLTTPFPVKTILFHNFNFDGDELKSEHKQELDKRVVKQIIEKRQVVRITGHASKQGDAHYNMELSRRRAIAVRDYLLKKGVPPEFLPLDELRARGEEDSKSRFEDDELDRGVTVEFVTNFKPKPSPPKPKQDPLPPPPDTLIKPPFKYPMPVPNMMRLVVVREVFINHRLHAKDPGEHKGESTVSGWSRIDSLTVLGQAPVPFERELDHTQVDQKFFINPIQFLSGQREQFDSIAYYYKYDPASLPSSAAPFELPQDSRACHLLYDSGTLVDQLPR